MPKCQLCGYSSRKRKQFFRCWNKETETGCKRYTCNNCIFVMQKTTSYENFICPNTFCNEEHKAETLLGLKEWFAPNKKVVYEKRVKLLENRESEVEKKLDAWEEKISANTKRMLIASTRANELPARQQYINKQLTFKFDKYNVRQQTEYLWLTETEFRNAILTKVTVNIDPKLTQFQPQFILRHFEMDILYMNLTGENMSFNLNYPIKVTDSNRSSKVQATIELQETIEYERFITENSSSDIMEGTYQPPKEYKVVLTFEFVAIGGGGT